MGEEERLLTFRFLQLFQFDQLSKLDKWKTTLLLRVKNTIEEGG